MCVVGLLNPRGHGAAPVCTGKVITSRSTQLPVGIRWTLGLNHTFIPLPLGGSNRRMTRQRNEVIGKKLDELIEQIVS